MKKITLLFLIFIANTAIAQEKMTTNKGIINFEASVPFFEEVKAINKKIACVLITKTGEITCFAIIKNFQFERSLMEEHFNKNYMQSHRFPKAIFKGRIEKFDLKNIDSNATEYQITGKITMHGKSKKIIVLGTIKKGVQGIELNTNFPLNTDDFKIEIPFIVRSKVSKNVNTQLYCILQ
ncbi:YceI family protein [Flavobacterium gawalongense]|uniref:YceI family protein n=1 Tax=Flavobacterium gawalongense TaxID=2594432 RepID=A0A553BA10_9FLAO|nr:YceI family protein [Flavobacterium gawalongense]TRW97100.1 YceI family protein [Flavobacterium gawalongense]TRX01814.1 YceI family protein [Flavobacterium gawalongense]TRX05090.1 YceI family protein [Flavobacterium gawalongense]TRX05969.1 YceI family protein [Flavobacterium gawalongense]TRX21778.1 YceI family protein [Flavobacterium gawalongense]